MTKSNEPGGASSPKSSGRSIGRVQATLHGEVNQTLHRAKEKRAGLVRLGPLILFSTENGDAWLLDAEDGLALCLAQDGTKQPFAITETPAEFGVEWSARFRIEDDRLVVTDRAGQVRIIPDSPAREILRLTAKWE